MSSNATMMRIPTRFQVSELKPVEHNEHRDVCAKGCIRWHSGIPLEIVALDFWVPGAGTRHSLAKYKGKCYEKIIIANVPNAMLYFCRATQAMSDVCDSSKRYGDLLDHPDTGLRKKGAAILDNEGQG